MGELQKKLQDLSDSYQGLQTGEWFEYDVRAELTVQQSSRPPWNHGKGWSRSSKKMIQSRR